MRTHIEADLQRAAVACEEFKTYFVDWWPAPYKAMLPVTCDGKVLLAAKEQIEALMKRDVEAYLAEQQNPWIKSAPDPITIDWSGMAPVKVYAAFLGRERPLGMPAAYKMFQKEFYGNPDVAEAERRVHQTAEYVADIAVERALKEAGTAERVYADAYNNKQDPAAVKSLEKEKDRLLDLHKAASEKFERLRADVNKGLRIVRDPLTPEAVAAEKASVEFH